LNSRHRLKQLNDEGFHVTKMKALTSKAMKLKALSDNSIVVCNHAITVRDIPVEAYDYIVNDTNDGAIDT